MSLCQNRKKEIYNTRTKFSQCSSLQDSSHWPIVDPLPSYGRGIDIPGARHRSLINGYNLTDVLITGMNLKASYFKYKVGICCPYDKLLIPHCNRRSWNYRWARFGLVAVVRFT